MSILGTIVDPLSGGQGLTKPGGIFPDSVRDKGRNFLNGIPFVGGMFKGLFGDPEQEAMQAAMKKAQEELTKQRAYMMEGRMNAMNLGALAFGPRNQMLGEMMGKGKGQNAMDIAPMLQNPMPQQQQQDIRTAAFGAPQQAPMSREEEAIRGMGRYKGWH